MSGIDSIIKKITDEAKETANSIIAEAITEAEQIVRETHQDISKRDAAERVEAEKNATLRAERIDAAALLEQKKELLREKQQLISEAYKKAESILASLEDSEYDALVKKLSAGIRGEIKPLERDKSMGTGGGFVAVDGKVVYNCSFTSLVRGAYEVTEKEVANILFE